MPPDPTASLSSKQHLPTTTDDIGHVAPDFDDRKLFNSLVIRPTMRISLRVGQIEDLFPFEPNTPRGRAERLGVVGCFYFPLGHSQAGNALNGIPAAAAAPPNPAVPAVMGAWEYFKTRVLNSPADDATADIELGGMLETRVLDGNMIPPPADEGATPTEANFTKLRFPGGYTYMAALTASTVNLNNDAAYTANEPSAGGAIPWDLRADVFQVETLYRRDNPVLGQIPLVATAEKWNTITAAWEPMGDAQIYFELLPPYDLPAFDPTRGVHEQLNRPPLRNTTVGPPNGAGGPIVLNDAQEGRNPAAGNPQANNAPSDRGGKRGAPSLGGTDPKVHIFKTDSTPGFNTAHVAGTVAATAVWPASPGRALPHPEYPVAEVDTPTRVKVKTNAQGEAGLIFMPSRCGGDRYRIRAFIGAPTMASNGSETSAVRVDTGTMVVWRNMRISRYLRQQVNNPAAAMLAEVNNGNYNITSNNAYLQRAFVVDGAGVNQGFQTADFSDTGTASAVFDGIKRQWARGFVEVDIDHAAQSALPEDLTQADWQRAMQTAMRDATTGMGTMGLNLNLPLLYYQEAGTTVNVTNAVCDVPMRTWQTYNSLVPAAQRIVAGPGGNTIARVSRLTTDYMLPGFLRALSNNGYAPGATVIQAAYGFTWQVIGLASNFSGIALEYRGCYVWAGGAAYPAAIIMPPKPPGPWMTYGYSCNTAHELGHCHYREHGPGFDPGASAPGGGNAAEHDVQTSNESICVMSYQTCEGQFCAKCLFSFRGWDVMSM